MSSQQTKEDQDETEAFLQATKDVDSQDSVNRTPVVEIAKEEKPSPKINCSFIPFLAFMLLGAIWGSAFLFIRFGVHQVTGFPPVRKISSVKR